MNLARLLAFALFVMGLLATPLPAADTQPAPQPPADAQLDLFLLIGQSNMSGRGKIEPEDTRPIPHLWTLTQKNRWAPATDPLHFDKPIAGVGLGRSFGKILLDKTPDAHIGLIPCAVGGTSIDQWARGGKLYTAALERARAAQPHGRFKAILWHQGESDCSPEHRAVYLQKLQQLIADLRQDLNAPELPFVAGQLGVFDDQPKSRNRAPFNQMILDLPQRVPHTAVARADGAKSIGDGTHFDAPTQRELGRRYAAEYLRLAAPAETKPAPAK